MELIAALTDIFETSEQPIIAIDGPAGAGKTTLAETLSLALAQKFSISLVHMDDLYPGWDGALGNELTQSLIWITSCHKAKKDLTFAPFNWDRNSFEAPRHSKSTTLLILEGVGSAQRAIEEHLTTSIWLDLDPQTGFQRVIKRDGGHISDSMTRWLDQQRQHFTEDDTKERSEFIIST